MAVRFIQKGAHGMKPQHSYITRLIEGNIFFYFIFVELLGARKRQERKPHKKLPQRREAGTR
jgi:hypothetical protein